QVLADKIVYLIKNEQVRKRFGKTNRQIIQQRAEYEKEMAKIERIYRELNQGIETGNADQKPSN
ncbi:unnamed protein product, partial [marine sediment metagenome]